MAEMDGAIFSELKEVSQEPSSANFPDSLEEEILFPDVPTMQPVPDDVTANEELRDDELSDDPDVPLPPLPFNQVPAEFSDNDMSKPAKLSASDKKQEQKTIRVLGLGLVARAYSKNWAHRGNALVRLQEKIESHPDSPKEDTRDLWRAAIRVLERTLKDNVFQVFSFSLMVLKQMYDEFAPRHKVTKGDLILGVDRSIPILLAKTGDTVNCQMQKQTKQFVIDMASFPNLKPLRLVTAHCVKPFSSASSPKLAKSRCEIVQQLLHTLTLNPESGLTVDNTMKFSREALQHTGGEVRVVAERIIIYLYQVNATTVRKYLPADEPSTRKNLKYRKLFEAFDELDGKPSKKDEQQKKDEQERKKDDKIKELQTELHVLQRQTAEAGMQDDGRAQIPTRLAKSARQRTTITQAEKLEKTCVFCGEYSKEFTEEGLDVHYWKHCPMLKRCSNCKQVVEISGMSDHLVSECRDRNMYMQCPRCTEAMRVEEYHQHRERYTCHELNADKEIFCPLCGKNIPDVGEEGWKRHLMGENACVRNSRNNKGNKKHKNAQGAASSSRRGSEEVTEATANNASRLLRPVSNAPPPPPSRQNRTTRNNNRSLANRNALAPPSVHGRSSVAPPSRQGRFSVAPPSRQIVIPPTPEGNRSKVGSRFDGTVNLPRQSTLEAPPTRQARSRASSRLVVAPAAPSRLSPAPPAPSRGPRGGKSTKIY